MSDLSSDDSDSENDDTASSNSDEVEGEIGCDDDDDNAMVIYTRYGRRATTWKSTI